MKSLEETRIGDFLVLGETKETANSNKILAVKCVKCGEIVFKRKGNLFRAKNPYPKHDCHNVHKITHTFFKEDRKTQSNNTTGKTGVKQRRDGHFSAQIDYYKKRYNLGSYKTVEEATAAREAVEKFIRESR